VLEDASKHTPYIPRANVLHLPITVYFIMSSRTVGNDPKTFADNFAITELYTAVLRFQRVCLGRDADGSMIETYNRAKHPTLSAGNKSLFKMTAAHMQNVLNWGRDIGLDMTIEEAGDIGKQGLPDLPGWVLGEEIKKSKHGEDWLQWSK